MESLLPSKPQAAPGPLSSFVRFVVCGGGIGVLSGLAVPQVAMTMPWAVANAVITVASTLLCTELHALFTFRTGRRPGWRRHLQSAGSATAAYVATCAAMFLLHAVQSSPSMLREQAVYLSASGLPASAASWSCACSSSRAAEAGPAGRWRRSGPRATGSPRL